MPYKFWCDYYARGRGKESPHLSREEQSVDGIPVVQMDHAFLQNTGDKDAKVTFLTGRQQLRSMVATAAQKKGHDKFVERFLLKGHWRNGAPDGQRNGTDRCGKTRGS